MAPSLAERRFWSVWKRVFGLSWPVMAEQVLRTLVRTTDLVVGVVLGYGVVAPYVAIVLDFAFRVVYVGAVFYRRRWVDRGATMMRERGSIEEHPSEE